MNSIKAEYQGTDEPDQNLSKDPFGKDWERTTILGEKINNFNNMHKVHKYKVYKMHKIIEFSNKPTFFDVQKLWVKTKSWI